MNTLYLLRKLWHKYKPLPLWCDVCPSCNGVSGFVSSYDPSPAGISLSPGCMYDFDECTECCGNNKCPSCNVQLSQDDAYILFSDDKAQCPFCRYSLSLGADRCSGSDDGWDDDFDPFMDDWEGGI